MQYRRLGRSGLKVSRICLGCATFGTSAGDEFRWTLDEEKARPIIKKALDVGINFFDTANVYSAGASEEILGRAIKDFTARDEVVIATKVHGPMRAEPNGRGLSRKGIFTEIENSLRRLGTDYIDLYQIHRWDDETPIEETLDALNDVVRAGKARYLGASTMFAWQFAKSLYLADANRWKRFATMQNHYNLLYREEEREMIPLCVAEGIGVLPWSPLARGRLTRPWDQENATLRGTSDTFAKKRYRRDDQASQSIVTHLIEVAAKREVSPAQVALAWLFSKPYVTSPIIGITNPAHLDDAVASLRLQLSDEEITLLEIPYTAQPMLDFE